MVKYGGVEGGGKRWFLYARFGGAVEIVRLRSPPHRHRQHVNTKPRHSAHWARASSLTRRLERVGPGRANLPLGVTVGKGRGKLLPMRARLHEPMWCILPRASLLSITCQSLSVDSIHNIHSSIGTFACTRDVHSFVNFHSHLPALLLHHWTYSVTSSTMSAMRSSIKAATPLLRACGPNAVRRTHIGTHAPAARLTQLPSRSQCVTPAAVRCYASSTEQANSKTGLYDLHVSKGAKMVPFGGFMMPVQYSDLGVGESHKWTREKASLFDVSHM